MITSYHKEIIAQFPPNEWVKPTNNNSNDYSVFSDLHEWGLVENKRIDNYKGKRFIGATILFKYPASLIN